MMDGSILSRVSDLAPRYIFAAASSRLQVSNLAPEDLYRHTLMLDTFSLRRAIERRHVTEASVNGARNGHELSRTSR
jgi:hypothetical protein